MALDYTTYVDQIANLMAEESTSAGFQTLLPGCIAYAENRIYRELDLIYTTVTDGSVTFTANNRLISPPSTIGQTGYLVIESMNVVYPSTAVYPAGARYPVQFVSRAFVDSVYPSNSAGTGMPQFAYMQSPTQIVVGPAPDLGYTVEFTGTYRPETLSSANSSTFLTQLVPELFVAASMVFVSGFMRDFGAQADNPQQAQSWENQYQTLFKSAQVEELRKQYMSQAWTSKQPNPVATPPRV